MTCRQPLGARLVRDALLVPVSRSAVPGMPFMIGVYDAASGAVPEGAFLHRGRNLAVAPPCAPARRIPGRHVFAGVLLQHFGHAILESLSRAWSLKAEPDLPALWLSRSERPSRPMLDLLDMVGFAAPAHAVIHDPVVVEELLVPQQGCEFGGFYHPQQAAALAVQPFGDSIGGRRVWLSRSFLPDGVARIEGESEIEHHLAAAGWTILAPERLPLAGQLAALVGAQEIAGFMGSAFHLVLLLEGVSARVRILDRGLPRDLVQTYLSIAEAKGLRQELLGAPGQRLRRVGPRDSIRLDTPSDVVALLLG